MVGEREKSVFQGNFDDTLGIFNFSSPIFARRPVSDTCLDRGGHFRLNSVSLWDRERF